ncbi:hypothetical protein ACFCYM_15660, partial [Streptomyces sp. NPDC056254]
GPGPAEVDAAGADRRAAVGRTAQEPAGIDAARGDEAAVLGRAADPALGAGDPAPFPDESPP